MAAKPKRTVTRAREELVWELASRGQTCRTIAVAVGESGLGRMCFQGVAKMLQRLTVRHLARMEARIKYEKAVQHATHEAIKREAWVEWDRSKAVARIKQVKSTAVEGRHGGEALPTPAGCGPELPATEITRTLKTRLADPRYLDVIIKACAAQRAIWGIDASPKDPPADQGAADPEAARRALLAADGVTHDEDDAPHPDDAEDRAGQLVHPPEPCEASPRPDAGRGHELRDPTMEATQLELFPPPVEPPEPRKSMVARTVAEEGVYPTTPRGMFSCRVLGEGEAETDLVVQARHIGDIPPPEGTQVVIVVGLDGRCLFGHWSHA